MTGDLGPGGPIAEVDAEVRFTPRPRLVRAERRVAWRLAVLVLTIGRFNKQAVSVRHLHIVGWALKSNRSREAFLALWDGRRTVSSILERLDLNLPVTLGLAFAYDLVELRSTQRVALTDSGRTFAAEINGDEALLRIEKEFFDRLGPKLSDALMERTFRAPVGVNR